MPILTIDIGGSEIKSALYRRDGSLIADYPARPSAISAADNQLEAQITALCREVQAEQALEGVAISSSAVINPYSGRVEFAGPTIPNYTGANLKSAVERACGLPCSIENDVNSMALGEAWLGAAKGQSSAFCLTLGTGLGGALLLDGKLWRGANFTAGEIGQMPRHDGRRTEEIVSTTALLHDYQQRGGNGINGREFFRRLRAGEARAEAAFQALMEELAQSLMPVIFLFAPQAIIVGGGISAQREFIEPQLKAAIAKRLPPYFMPGRIACAELGNAANMLGALRWFLDSETAAEAL